MLKMNPGCNSTFFDDFVWNNFIPEDDPLIRIKKFINLDFLESLVKDSYQNGHSAGRDPIDPRTLFLACLLEFIKGYSDVEVAKQIQRMPLYRWFVGLSFEDRAPDDTTISFFRTQRMGEEKFKEAFNQVVKQLKEAELIDGQIQSQDATDMRGDIAILNVFQLLNKCRESLLRATKRLDRALYKKWEKKFSFTVIPNPKNKQKHFEELIALCQRLYQEALKNRRLLKDRRFNREVTILARAVAERKDERFDGEGKKQKKEEEEKITGKMINPSDPDASWGAKSDKRFFADYKAEVNTDHKYGIITEIEVNKAGHAEEKSATPMLERQNDNLGIIPLHFTADAKYDYGNTRTELRALGVANVYIPLVSTKNKEGGLVWDNFYFEGGHLFCPAGYPAERRFNDERRLGFEYKFNAEVCGACELRSECTRAEYGRSVFISHTQLERKEALAFNTTEEYETVYKEQHWKVEPKNADLKRYNGLRRARYRGLARVRIQAYLSVIASNFKKFVKWAMGKLKNEVMTTLAKLAALAPPGGALRPDTG